MERKKVTVLHITADDKFFDDVFEDFQSVEQFDNVAIFQNRNKNYVFRYIKKRSVVQILSASEIKKYLKNARYDVVYYHSIPYNYWYQLRYIPRTKTVIWWMWGYDVYFGRYVYNERCGMGPLIKLNLYKSCTAAILPERIYDSLRRRIKLFIRKYYDTAVRFYGLRRIDYFQPVLNVEYRMMKNVLGFRAEETYTLFSYKTFAEAPVDSRNPEGNILFGNSSTYSNNHLDVIEYLKRCLNLKCRLVLPISYSDKRLADILISEEWLCEQEAFFLKEFIPSDDFYKIVDTCSYMVSGVIRQQSIGSIEYALRTGIKVFLYQDSIVYKYCTHLGYIVFPIEEIDSDSFRVPLDSGQMYHNYQIWKSEWEKQHMISMQLVSDLVSKYC